MSSINDALSKLTEKDKGTTSQIERIEVKPVRRFTIWPWLLGTFATLAALGVWAFVASGEEEKPSVSSVETVKADITQNQLATPIKESQQTSSKVASVTQTKQSSVKAPPSPTVTASPDVARVYTAKEVSPREPKKAPSSKPPQQDTLPNRPEVIAKASVPKAKPLPKKTIVSTPSDDFVIEQVELTHRQLADKAVEEAQKALDANNIKSALKEYSIALRYVPKDEVVRQKLAALYYGRGDARKAFELLQQGIQLNKNGEVLRFALAKLLMKEDRSEAALVPLVYLPTIPSTPYLSLRAALAQKNNQDAVALESYQMLVKQDGSNGRWWLGLAIQQERDLDIQSATQSYQNALTRVGISKRSQQFIRDRLKLLSSLDGGSSAN